MRNKRLVLMVFVVQALALQLLAAEKSRDWQTGQVVESKAALGPQVHTFAAGAKNYLVRGSVGDQDLNVGDNVRFAVEGKSMFVSIAGKEYKLYLLGETVASPSSTEPAELDGARPAAHVPAQAPQTTAPRIPSPQVKTPPPAVTADKPRPEAVAALDNDAVVKMLVGGLKEDTVVTVIGNKPGNYALTPDALAGLKAAGVPQSVLNAMSAKMKARR